MTEEDLRKQAWDFFQMQAGQRLTTFKFYMGGYPKGNPIGLEMVDDAVLYESMLRIRDLGPYAYCMVHCEDDALVLHLTRQVRERGGDTLADYAATRPDFAEEQDIRRAVWFAGLTGCPLYIVHTTIGSALDVTTPARRDGTRVIVETCPHYLALTLDDERLAARGPGAGLVAPPLRSEEDRVRLWRGVADGEVDTIGTDHVPITKTGAGLWDERPGFSGLAVSLPVVLTYGYLEGHVDLPTVARAMAERPARIFGYHPRKGAILPGADADLAVIDLETERVVGPDTTLTPATTAFEDVPLRGWPRYTVRRGEVIFRDGEYLGTPGSGRLLTPSA